MSRRPAKPAGSLEGIAAAAAAAGERAGETPQADRISALEARIASIEPLLEQLQATSELSTKIGLYVEDLREEQRFFNVARIVVGVACVLSVIGLIVLLGLAIFHPRSPMLSAPPVAIATFIIGVVSGVVLILAGFVRGVFRTTVERHADGFLPPAFSTAVDALQKIIGKAN